MTSCHFFYCLVSNYRKFSTHCGGKTGNEFGEIVAVGVANLVCVPMCLCVMATAVSAAVKHDFLAQHLRTENKWKKAFKVARKRKGSKVNVRIGSSLMSVSRKHQLIKPGNVSLMILQTEQLEFIKKELQCSTLHLSKGSCSFYTVRNVFHK